MASTGKKKKQEPTPLFCPFCDRRSVRPLTLRRHIGSHTPQETAKAKNRCVLCGKQFKETTVFLEHVYDGHWRNEAGWPVKPRPDYPFLVEHMLLGLSGRGLADVMAEMLFQLGAEDPTVFREIRETLERGRKEDVAGLWDLLWEMIDLPF